MQITLTVLKPNNISFSGKKSDKKELKIKTFGNVSKTFVHKMNTGLQKFPDALLKEFKKENLLDEVRLAPKASTSVPDFPEKQLEYKHDKTNLGKFTDDQAMAGVYGVIKKPDGKCFRFLGFYENPTFKHFTGATRGTVGHEITHLIDQLHKKQEGTRFSQTEKFKAAFKKDLTNLPAKQMNNPLLMEKITWTNMDYITQNNTPENITPRGLKEIFAECGASLTTGSTIEVQAKTKFMDLFFPESRACVKKHFLDLGIEVTD